MLLKYFFCFNFVVVIVLLFSFYSLLLYSTEIGAGLWSLVEPLHLKTYHV